MGCAASTSTPVVSLKHQHKIESRVDIVNYIDNVALKTHVQLDSDPLQLHNPQSYKTQLYKEQRQSILPTIVQESHSSESIPITSTHTRIASVETEIKKSHDTQMNQINTTAFKINVDQVPNPDCTGFGTSSSTDMQSSSLKPLKTSRSIVKSQVSNHESDETSATVETKITATTAIPEKGDAILITPATTLPPPNAIKVNSTPPQSTGQLSNDALSEFEHFRQKYKIMSKSNSKNDTDALFTQFIQNHPEIPKSFAIQRGAPDQRTVVDAGAHLEFEQNQLRSTTASRVASVVNSDITRHLSTKMLAHSSERDHLWESTFGPSKEGICVINHKGNILYSNSALSMLLSDKELHHKNISYYIPKTVYNFSYKTIPKSLYRREPTHRQDNEERESKSSEQKSASASISSLSVPESPQAQGAFQNANVNVVHNNPDQLRTIYNVEFTASATTNNHPNNLDHLQPHLNNLDHLQPHLNNLDHLQPHLNNLDAVILKPPKLATEMNIVEQDFTLQENKSALTMTVEIFTNSQRLIAVRLSCGPIVLTPKDRCYSFVLGFQDVTDSLHLHRSNFDLIQSLPEAVGKRIHQGETNICSQHSNVTVSCISVTPSTNSDLMFGSAIETLTLFYEYMDALAIKYNVMRIDNLGTSYLFVSGLWNDKNEHFSQNTSAGNHATALSLNVKDFALKNHVVFLRECLTFAKTLIPPVVVMCGITSGTVTSVILGKRKLRFQMMGPSLQRAVDLLRVPNAICCDQVDIVNKLEPIGRSELTGDYFVLVE